MLILIYIDVNICKKKTRKTIRTNKQKVQFKFKIIIIHIQIFRDFLHFS